MTIRAIAFDIGGVLEFTPRIGVTENWEAILHLQSGELDKKQGSQCENRQSEPATIGSIRVFSF